jgi:dCTP diphosphatase
MKTLDVAKIQAEIDRFAQERDWDQFHSVKNLSMAMSVEAGELAEIFQWMTEAQSNAVMADADTMGKVRDELADVLVYLLRIAGKTGVDLQDAVEQKMKKNALKYPVDKAKGRSTKYDSY